MRLITALTLLISVSLLGGCGSADDVEISLPFVGDIMAKANTKDKKMANRGTLVLPPKVDSLPEPGNQQASNTESWPEDPDIKAKTDAEIAAAKEKQYQRDGDWKDERKTANGLEDFNKKIDWSKRQPGIFRSIIDKAEK